MGSSSGGGGGGGSSSSSSGGGGSILSSAVSAISNAINSVSNTGSGSSSGGKYNPRTQSQQESINRYGQLYNQATTAGDTALADSYHRAANKIRESIGLKPGIDFDPVSGKEYGRPSNETPTQQTQPIDYTDPNSYSRYKPIDNTALYQQQAAEKLASIRAAIGRQKTSAQGNISNIQNQYDTAATTAQNQARELPGQFTQLNNQASNRGQINAQRIRTAMAQMGLGQSGESASQQLQQGIDTSNQINTNNQQLQKLTTDINTQITGLQGEKAAKIAAIQQAIADAEASGDDNAALALSEAQAKIVSEASQNAVAQNQWNASIIDKIRAAKETAQTNAWNRGGFDSAYGLWQAQEAAKLEKDKTASDYELAGKIRLAREEASLGKYKTSGSSGGLTAHQQYQIDRDASQSGLKNTQWIENEASMRARSDKRLADEYHPADGVNYFTLAQLIDAHRRDLQSQLGTNSSGGGMTDAELMQYLK